MKCKITKIKQKEEEEKLLNKKTKRTRIYKDNSKNKRSNKEKEVITKKSLENNKSTINKELPVINNKIFNEQNSNKSMTLSKTNPKDIKFSSTLINDVDDSNNFTQVCK